MTATSFRDALVGDTGPRYEVHTLRKQTDLGGLFARLSPSAQAFLERVCPTPDTLTDDVSVAAINWREAPAAMRAFEALGTSDRCDVISYCTVPVHEMQHHVDLLQTPFGANVHATLIHEYRAFQDFSLYLIHDDSASLLPPGRIASLDDVLRARDQSMASDVAAAWRHLKPLLQLAEVWGDFDHVATASVDLRRNDVREIFGHRFYAVTVDGWWPSFTVDEHAPWYVRPSTLLEGRAVMTTLGWMASRFGALDDWGRYSAEAIDAVYSGADYDYTFLGDVAAWLGGYPGFIDLLKQGTPREVMFLVAVVWVAAWNGLHAPPPRTDVRTMAVPGRFLSVLAYGAVRMADRRQLSPSELLDPFDSSDWSASREVTSVEDSVAAAISELDDLDEVVATIFNRDVRDHYGAVIGMIRSYLSRRQGHGYQWEPGMPLDGDPLRAATASSPELLDPYSPPASVERWAEFRRRGWFRPTSAARIRPLLESLFWTDPVAIPCLCGTELPLWLPREMTFEFWTLTCTNCARVFVIDDAAFATFQRQMGHTLKMQFQELLMPCSCGATTTVMLLDCNKRLSWSCGECDEQHELSEEDVDSLKRRVGWAR